MKPVTRDTSGMRAQDARAKSKEARKELEQGLASGSITLNEKEQLERDIEVYDNRAVNMDPPM